MYCRYWCRSSGNAVLFARLGAKLALTDRDEAKLQRTRDECVRAGPADSEQPLLVIAELSSETDVARLFDTTIKKLRRLDVLVNNAGTGEYGTIETTSLEQYDRTMNVNVRAAYLIATRGSIVNVSSLLASRSVPGALAYSMSKAAIDQMTSCTALELAAKGVRVNSVNPGITDTAIYKRGGMSDDDIAKLRERCKTTHPLGRIGNVEDVAQAIAFLAYSRGLMHHLSLVNISMLTVEDMQLAFVDF